MPRPFLPRTIQAIPGVAVYKPAGVPAHGLSWIELALDEYEAIRLVDAEGLDQEAAAAAMGVSRPTVTRILARGRAKLAKMLTCGAALAIRGGPVAALGARPGRYGRGWAGGGPGRMGPGRGRGRGRGFGFGRNGNRGNR